MTFLGRVHIGPHYRIGYADYPRLLLASAVEAAAVKHHAAPVGQPPPSVSPIVEPESAQEGVSIFERIGQRHVGVLKKRRRSFAPPPDLKKAFVVVHPATFQQRFAKNKTESL